MRLSVVIISKVLLLTYVVVSPFINHSYLMFLNNYPVKFLFLITVVFMPFIELELAILLMIVFLILLVNFKKIGITKAKNTTRIEKEPRNEQKKEIYGGEFKEVPVVHDASQFDYQDDSAILNPYNYYMQKLSPPDSLQRIQDNTVN